MLDRICDSNLGFALVAYGLFCIVSVVATAVFYGGIAIVWITGQGIFGG